MTPVTRAGTGLAGAALLAGVLVAVPAVADPPSDPIPGPVGRLLVQPSGGDHARRERRDLGHTHAEDGVLRRGCHDYTYRYAIEVRSDDWTLETFLDDRTGETIASGTYSAESDPKKGPGIFRFCRYSTYAGRFTIRAKLSWYNDAGDHHGWFEPSHFWLRRP
jgi:hypothetical protein